LDIQKIKS